MTPTQLPLPFGGEITHVIHLSDLHIRAGDSRKCRYNEYVSAIDFFGQALSGLPCVVSGNAVIAIIGDVFHDKGTIGAAGVMLFRRLLHWLRVHKLPVYIIRGNHDFQQGTIDTTEPDLIASLLHSMAAENENVVYLSDTGLYEAGNIGFGLLAIQDVLQLGSGSGIRNDIPAFPDPSDFSSRVTTRIALFHGALKHCMLQNGTTCTSAQMTASSILTAYDFAMLGDIHLQQVHAVPSMPLPTPHQRPDLDAIFPIKLGNHAQRLQAQDLHAKTWAYSGSLIQQNHGEPLLGHGFIVWDLHSSAQACYHVHNTHGMLTITRDPTYPLHQQWRARIMHAGEDVPIQEVVNHAWFPKKLRVRITNHESEGGTSSDTLKAATSMLRSLGCTVEDATITNAVQSTSTDTSALHTVALQTISDLASSAYSPSTWINYVLTRDHPALQAENADTWQAFFQSPELLTIPSDVIDASKQDLNPTALSRVDDRNKKVLKAIKEYSALAQRRPTRTEKTLTLLELEWAWLLCYGDDCVFDFQNASGHVCAVSGGNATGKTAFMEIIYFALFGVGFPSRASSHSSAFINMNKPPGKRAFVKITFRLGEDIYKIIRKLDASTTSLKNTDVTLSKQVNGELFINEAIGRPKVTGWVNEHIGDADAFLQACMLSQHNDNCFYALAPKDQMLLLDKLLAMDGAAHLIQAFKEARKAHNMYMEAVDNALDAQEKSLQHMADSNADRHEASYKVDEMDQLESQLQSHASEMERVMHEKRDAWMMMTDRVSTGTTQRINTYPPGLYTQDVADMLTAHESSRPVEKPQITEAELKTRQQALNATLAKLPEDALSYMDLHQSDDEQVDQGELAKLRCEYSDMIAQSPSQPRTTAEELQRHPIVHDDELSRLQDEISTLSSSVNTYPVRDINLVTSLLHQKAEFFENRKTLMNIEDSAAKLQDTEERLEFVKSQAASARSTVAELQKHQASLSSSRPLAARGSAKDRQEWTQEYENAVRERWCDAQGEADTLAQRAARIKSASTRVEKAQRMLQDNVNSFKTLKENNRDIPFNPECHACCKQPWKLQLLQLKQTILEVCKPQVREANDELDGLLDGKTQQDWQQLLDLQTSRASRWKELQKAKEFWDEEDARAKQQAAWDEDWTRTESALSDGRNMIATLEQEQVTLAQDIAVLRQANEWLTQGLEGELEHLQNGQRLKAAQARLEAASFWNEEHSRHETYGAWQGKLKSLSHTIHDMEHKLVLGEVLSCRPEKRFLDAQQALMDVWLPWVNKYDELRLLLAKLQFLEAERDWSAARDKLLTTRSETRVTKEYAVARQKLEGVVEALKSHKADMLLRCTVLTAMADCLDGFKSWVYETQLMPMFVRHVNTVIASLCSDQQLALKVKWQESRTGDRVPVWFLDNDCISPPLEKASGFQRFITSFSTRLALNQLGACGITPCTHLFIDEGFTSCDAQNLEKVPNFLKNLIQNGTYTSILLVTHLDAVFRCATKRITINRNGLLRSIQFTQSSTMYE